MAAVSFETTKAHAALSWATIVKRGDSDASAEETAGSAAPGKTALSPGPRGSRTCECRGQVIMMLAYYGWIAPLQEIDHPDADKHQGHIYVRSTDVAGGASLAPGQTVSFFLYADDQGLGAEDCRPEGTAAAAEFCFRAAAPEFVSTADAFDAPTAGDEKAQDAADAETDLSSDAGGDSEGAGSDSEDSLCAGLRGRGRSTAVAAFPFAQAINLDSYEEDSEPDTEACRDAVAMPPPAVLEDGGIGSAPWRSHGAPPGLERSAPCWRLACLEGGASLPRDPPWRRC